MSKVQLNKKIPDVETHITGDKQVRLSGYLGKPLVLYFYPKASTPGCTQEGLDFREAITRFRRWFCSK
jgi:peroxiredoxin Q/BCP